MSTLQIALLTTAYLAGGFMTAGAMDLDDDAGPLWLFVLALWFPSVLAFGCYMLGKKIGERL